VGDLSQRVRVILSIWRGGSDAKVLKAFGEVPRCVVIRQGSHAGDVHVNLPDDDAAWDEAAAACSDMIRDTTERLRASPEWRLEVIDESGAVRHLIRLTTESFD
jgi:hypothetical protein